ESPAPITPTTVRRTRTPSLSPQQKTEPGHCVHEQPALLPELIQEILDLLRSHLWAGHGDLVLDALPTEWPRATGERGREVEAEQDDHDPQQSITLHRGSSSFRCGHELGDGGAASRDQATRARPSFAPARALSVLIRGRAREILPGSPRQQRRHFTLGRLFQ